MSAWWWLRNVAPGPLVRLCLGPVVEGRFPACPAVVVSNHLSWADPGFLQLAVNRPLTFAVNARFFRRRGLSGAAMRWLLHACDAVPVDRREPETQERLVAAAARTLAAGGLFCVYPEGGIARDGHLHRGRSGIGRIVAATGAAVVPVAMLNTDRVAPPVRRRPEVSRVRLRVGQVLHLADLVTGPDDLAGIRAVTDCVMRELADLSERVYLDEYVHP